MDDTLLTILLWIGAVAIGGGAVALRLARLRALPDRRTPRARPDAAVAVCVALLVLALIAWLTSRVAAPEVTRSVQAGAVILAACGLLGLFGYGLARARTATLRNRKDGDGGTPAETVGDTAGAEAVEPD